MSSKSSTKPSTRSPFASKNKPNSSTAVKHDPIKVTQFVETIPNPKTVLLELIVQQPHLFELVQQIVKHRPVTDKEKVDSIVERKLLQQQQKEEMDAELEKKQQFSFKDADMLRIHECLHNKFHKNIVLQNVNYDIQLDENNCRFVKINSVTFVEQNAKQVNSSYAKMAQDGDKITWIVRPHLHWGLIVNGTIIQP